MPDEYVKYFPGSPLIAILGVPVMVTTSDKLTVAVITSPTL